MTDDRMNRVYDLMRAYKDTAQSMGIAPSVAIFACGMLAGLIGETLIEDDLLPASEAKQRLLDTFNDGLTFIMDRSQPATGAVQ